MRDPESTRKKILRQSGFLFNTQGYKATSISDITTATGFTKGAIYRHFKNKQELEKETLVHLSSIMFDHIRSYIQEQPTAPLKLRAIFAYFEDYLSKPPVKGGCPLMNVAIEADDSNAALRKEAVSMLDILHQSLMLIFKNGIKHKQLKKNMDKDYYATVIIASLEGAIMMSKLRGNKKDIQVVIKHLNHLLKEIEL